MRSKANADTGPEGARSLDVSSGIAAGCYDLLRADVISGALAPGERLSEASLSRQYGVSRSPVREALASLERDGLIERVGLVARVRQRTAEEMLDIYQVRIYLEGAIAGDAAQRHTSIDMGRIKAALELGVGIGADDPTALLTANRSFHNALAAASHNATLGDLQARLNAQIATLPAKTLGYPGRWPQAHEEHTEIMKAVEARDADGARGIAEGHMARARDIRIALYERDFSY